MKKGKYFEICISKDPFHPIIKDFILNEEEILHYDEEWLDVIKGRIVDDTKEDSRKTLAEMFVIVAHLLADVACALEIIVLVHQTPEELLVVQQKRIICGELFWLRVKKNVSVHFYYI